MISLYERRNGEKICDLDVDENDRFFEEILGVLPGNRLLTKDRDILYVYSLSDGKLLHKHDAFSIADCSLLPTKNVSIKGGIYDEYSVQEWFSVFNTTTFKETSISSSNDSFVEICRQEQYILSWRLKSWKEELQEDGESDSEESETSRQVICLAVHDSRTGEVVCDPQLPYGPCHEEKYDDDFDPIDYYGEDALISEHDWTEQDIHQYREREYWNGFAPRLIDPRIIGACYHPQWLLLYNEYGFEVYDGDGKSIFEHELCGIKKIWPITDTTIGVHVDSEIVEFDLVKRAELDAVDIGAAPKERPDLFLGFVKNRNPLTSVERSIIAGEVGKAQLWPDIFASASPVEWYSAYRPVSYWFETDERIRVENIDHKRSETIELWYGNKKVSLEEAGKIMQLEEQGISP